MSPQNARRLARSLLITCGLLASGALVNRYVIERADAEGIPPDSEALHYGGLLHDGEAPASGTRNITLNFWSTATPGDSPECQANAPGYLLVNGRFRIALPASCVAAIRASPQLFVEILVDGTSLGPPNQIGASPYAVEAEHVLGGQPVGAITAWYDANGTIAMPDCWQLCDGAEITDSRSPLSGHYTPDMTSDTYLTGTADALDWSSATATVVGSNDVSLGISESSAGQKNVNFSHIHATYSYNSTTQAGYLYDGGGNIWLTRDVLGGVVNGGLGGVPNGGSNAVLGDAYSSQPVGLNYSDLRTADNHTHSASLTGTSGARRPKSVRVKHIIKICGR